ncbi:uncharacterized protein METZ01_LOCUS360568 [marine metagenome]|uniref:Uncharacterized protein n=1 Tax=marine metagenome TaxID=408172 RepID=A0A382SCT2_9ZZZZ
MFSGDVVSIGVPSKLGTTVVRMGMADFPPAACVCSDAF